MAPFLVDPVSTFMLPVRRKAKKVTKIKSSGTKISKNAAIAIAVIAAVFVVAAIIFSIIQQRRRKARANKHSSTVPGYSTDNSGGLYGGTPGYFAGGGGGQQQMNGQEKPAMGGDGGAGHDYGQGEAASYYADSQYAHGLGGAQMPQRPPMAFNPSPAQP